METANWLQTLPQDDALYRSEHAAILMQVWAETDSIAASAWLSDHSIGPQRDAAIAGFAQSIQRFEPEAAATWANTITNPDQRLQKLQDSIRRWAANDPHAALNWVIRAELEPALQEQLARDIGID